MTAQAQADVWPRQCCSVPIEPGQIVLGQSSQGQS